MTRENTVNVPDDEMDAERAAHIVKGLRARCVRESKTEAHTLAIRHLRAMEVKALDIMLSAAPLHEGGWSELERLARAATPGPWMHEPDHYNDHGGRYDEICSPVETVSGEWGGPSGANAAFIAAANPATILKLIASARSAPLPSVEVFGSSAEGADTHRATVNSSSSNDGAA